MSRSRQHRRWVIPCVVVIAVLALTALIVVPVARKMTMRVPMEQGLAALVEGDVDGMRVVFTPNAEMQVMKITVAAERAIELARPLIEAKPIDCPVRFGGFYNENRLSDTRVEADCYILYYPDGTRHELLPNTQTPMRREAHVVMQRVGWFTWKIERLEVDDPELAKLAAKAAMRGVFGR